VTKDEFMQFLRDPEVCKEIFEIVKKGGKPATPAYNNLEGLRQKLKSSPPPQTSTPIPSATPAQTVVTPKVQQPTLQTRTAQATSQPKPAQKPSLVVDPSKIPQPPPPEEPKTFSSMADKLKFLRSHVNRVEEEKIAAEEAAKAAESLHPSEKFTVVLEKRCPICEQKSRVVKPKSRLNTERRDVDYCVHFKDFDPYLYTVFACEHCGFAAEEKKFTGVIPNKTKESLREFLSQNDMKMPFSEERSPQDALSFFELAILFSELTDHSKGRQAILNLNAAWVCRCEGLPDRERVYMEQAAADFADALDNERWPINGISDDMAVYLCAAIYYLIGDYDRSTTWLGRTMNNANLRATAPKLFEQARDIWQEIKRVNKS